MNDDPMDKRLEAQGKPRPVTDEQKREMVKWLAKRLHLQISAAENSPLNEEEPCQDCEIEAKEIVTHILNRLGSTAKPRTFVETAEHFKKVTTDGPCAVCKICCGCTRGHIHCRQCACTGKPTPSVEDQEVTTQSWQLSSSEKDSIVELPIDLQVKLSNRIESLMSERDQFQKLYEDCFARLNVEAQGPKCLGYPACDGDLEGELHSSECVEAQGKPDAKEGHYDTGDDK